MGAPTVFRMTGWFKIASAIATILLAAAGGSLFFNGDAALYRGAGVALLVFGAIGFADTLLSRMVLDDDGIEIVSLVRRTRYSRDEFESAKVDGGIVVLKRRDGGWVKLPDTGRNSLAVRNTVHAWIRRGKSGDQKE